MRRWILWTMSCALSMAADSVYVDAKMGLMWQDSPATANLKGDWEEAMDYCKRLELEGYNDWRLPKVKELYTLIDPNREDPAAIEHIRFVDSEDYWSASECVADLSDAWLVYFEDGVVNHYSKTRDRHIRCVRDVK